MLADELGYESVWIADHLVLPQHITGELVAGEEHPPVDPHTPVFDVPVPDSPLTEKLVAFTLRSAACAPPIK